MRRTYVTFIACTAASIGLSFAQVIKTDTMNALTVEWQDPSNAVHCLNALRLCTLYTPDPERAVEDALQELVAAARTSQDFMRASRLIWSEPSLPPAKYPASDGFGALGNALR